MKIGIHYQENFFSERWVKYCIDKQIAFKLVNAYDSDIVSQLDDCDAFMWHFGHDVSRLFAKQLIFSLQATGKKVFPDINTCWHFDDKVAQKYLLESIGAPLVPSYSFYNRGDALEWAKKATFPKVLKLRGGAASANVKLVKTRAEAEFFIKKAFGRGIPYFDAIDNLREKKRNFKDGNTGYVNVIKAYGRLFFQNSIKVDLGYIYFQDFMPGNRYDIRVIVTGDKAFAIKRVVRPNDFRASGSGYIIYEKNEIDERCVQVAFEINNKLKSQSTAFDFVFDPNNKPKILEISYGYIVCGYDPCPGYWDKGMKWHKGLFKPQEWQIENLIREIESVPIL